MRAGHSSVKASLHRFNIVSTAECECGDRLQMEEYTRWFKYDRDLCGLFTHKSVPVIFESPCIFWDCKLYEDQRAKMMDILSENSKKNTQSQLQSSSGYKKKRFVQGICYFINNIPKLKKKRKRSRCTNY
jgi:hypothetical protein